MKNIISTRSDESLRYISGHSTYTWTDKLTDSKRKSMVELHYRLQLTSSKIYLLQYIVACIWMAPTPLTTLILQVYNLILAEHKSASRVSPLSPETLASTTTLDQTWNHWRIFCLLQGVSPMTTSSRTHLGLVEPPSLPINFHGDPSPLPCLHSEHSFHHEIPPSAA